MKNIQLLLLFVSLFIFGNCKKDKVGLTEAEVIQGLKEALTVGSGNSSEKANKADGYFGNQLIKIPFPQEAEIVATTLNDLGMKFLVDTFVLKLNRAAEHAAIKAKPIFASAITSMTIADGFNILKGANNAATEYLKNKTYTDLKTAFKPDIQNSLDAVGASDAWSAVTTAYNQIPLVDTVNTDLPAYTTGKGLDGLFVLVADEELKIRKDPAARVSDILKKVFDENNW